MKKHEPENELEISCAIELLRDAAENGKGESPRINDEVKAELRQSFKKAYAEYSMLKKQLLEPGTPLQEFSKTLCEYVLAKVYPTEAPLSGNMDAPDYEFEKRRLEEDISDWLLRKIGVFRDFYSLPEADVSGLAERYRHKKFSKLDFADLTEEDITREFVATTKLNPPGGRDSIAAAMVRWFGGEQEYQPMRKNKPRAQFGKA